MAAIELQGVCKRFGGTVVLDGIDLSIGDGEFVVFVGPSGCGKSTLLRLIAGLEGVTEGRVRIGERDVTDLPPGRRDVAMVFQAYALYPHMTVRQNLCFGMRMRGLAAAEIQRRLDRVVQMLQLDPYLARRPGELSGGQCQRVAIGRALVQEPAVFLLDEPLSNLDAELRLRLRLELAALHRELGCTMVLVTHDQVEAQSLAQRIVVLRAGRVEQVGTPQALYEMPANTFVACFIGSPPMNLLPATLRTSPAGLEAELGSGARLPLLGHRGASDTRCLIGVRPEHLDAAPEGPLVQQVQAVERLGAGAWAHGHLAGTGQALCAQAAATPGLQPGALMRWRAAPEHLHLFSLDGQRLSAPVADPARPVPSPSSPGVHP